MELDGARKCKGVEGAKGLGVTQGRMKQKSVGEKRRRRRRIRAVKEFDIH